MGSLPWEGRSASAECPPQTGFNAFAFLAFILLTIDTVMNINNNISNNNNNNNNNDRNNNNNNNFESMNMNMNSGRGLGNNITAPDILFSERVSTLMKENNLSPWDRKVFKELQEELRERNLLRSNVDLIKVWLVSVILTSPSCLVVIPCL